MNNEINTGGPAFPHDDQAQHYERAGMTMRDYFAAKAMQALIASYKTGEPWSFDVDLSCCTSGEDDGGTDRCATGAYWFADAMLKARNA